MGRPKANRESRPFLYKTRYFIGALSHELGFNVRVFFFRAPFDRRQVRDEGPFATATYGLQGGVLVSCRDLRLPPPIQVLRRVPQTL